MLRRSLQLLLTTLPLNVLYVLYYRTLETHLNDQKDNEYVKNILLLSGHTVLLYRLHNVYLPFSYPSCPSLCLQLLAVGVKKLLSVPQPMYTEPQHSSSHMLTNTVKLNISVKLICFTRSN